MNIKAILSHINYKKSGKRGVTLVELIIYMGILAILIYIMTDILSSILNVQLATQSNSAATQDGRYIYSRITYDINRAQSVSNPASLGNSSNSMDMVINATNYNYRLVNDNLVISDGTGEYILNSPDTKVSDLLFTRVGNVNGKHTFQVDFTTTSTIQVNSKYDSERFQTTAGLR